MSLLLLVRHGQASFGEANYDKLSSRGEEQSKRLGAHWAKRGVRLDAVFTGPRERQIRTACFAGEAMRAAGLPFPEPTMLPELDEMAAEELLKSHVPRLLEQHPHVRALFSAFADARSRDESTKAFQKLLETVTGMWIRGDFDAPGIEPWPAFCDRVARGLAMVRDAGGKGRTVAVFTSGGTIGASMQHVLGTQPEVSVNLAWIVRNTAVTEILFSGDRLTLSSFNALPHLDDPALVTYR